MTYKELTAIVQVVSVAVVTWWGAAQVAGDPELMQSAPAAAAMLVTAIGISIAFNIVVMIVGSIVVSIAQRAEMKDERADERDRAITTRAMRNGYLVMSVAALAGLLLLAFGNVPTVTATYALFGAAMLGGAADAVSRLVYYRIG